jgi:putative glutathione S-transferase
VYLKDRRWLVGSSITEADLRLFVTLIRFDPVYATHFKCSKRRLVEYPNLWRHTRDFYQQPGVANTIHMSQIKEHYFKSHPQLNPLGIIPKGPDLDYSL